MRVIGLALLATSVVVLWVCLPAKGHLEKKSFLRGGADVVAAIVITACLGAGIVVTIVGFGR
jgi:hypothetical protein